MTLAVILFVSIFCASGRPPMAAPHQSAQESAPAGRPAKVTGTQDPATPAQSSIPATTSTPSPGAQTPTPQKPTVPQHPRHKKKRVVSNCVPAASASAPGSGSNGKGTSDPAGTPQDATANGQTPTTQPASLPVVCPPPKIIVRQGGTSEPSIQLAGGAGGDQATRQRANQMLGATEENLKKISGRQLATNQQDMLNQIHQFMAQSKSAIAAGDFERGRTLAWKAQLLSEELVTPQK